MLVVRRKGTDKYWNAVEMVFVDKPSQATHYNKLEDIDDIPNFWNWEAVEVEE